MKKKGVMSDFIIWILIALLVLSFLLMFSGGSNSKLGDLSKSIKSLFLFGK